jgi:hypothetical protein
MSGREGVRIAAALPPQSKARLRRAKKKLKTLISREALWTAVAPATAFTESV